MSISGSRVSIPSNLRRTIQDIKEIAGKHSDEDIYALLKECNMDPNETAQKLLYLDTFHEVKRKRDRKKVNASNQNSEEYRWMSGMQHRGDRSGRGNYSSNYISDDARVRRRVKQESGVHKSTDRVKQESGVHKSTDRSSKTSIAVAHKVEDNNTKSSHESATQVPADDESHAGRVISVDANQLAKRAILSTLPNLFIQHHPNLNPGPTPAPTPTFVPGARLKDETVISRPNELLTSMSSASVSGVYSSATDPVLVPALNHRNPGAVGTIKREVGSQRIAAESNGSPTTEGILGSCQGVTGTVNSMNTTGPRESQGVAVAGTPEPPKLSSFIHDKSLAVVANHESRPSEQVNGHSEVLASEAAAAALEAHLSSVTKQSDSAFEQAVSQLDMKLKKSNISALQPVIFPSHLQVPESFRNGLTFGSLDTQLEPSLSCGKDPMPSDETVPTNDRTTEEPPVSYQGASSTSPGCSYPDNLQSHQHVSETSSPFEGKLSGTSSKYDQPKQEMFPPFPGSQFQLLQSTPDYSYGLVSPMLGSHLVQIEGSEQQAGSSQAPSTAGSSVAQPMGLGQSSVAVSPHLFPLLRQPYHPNYIPYNPYLPHLYMPQSAHQFLGPSGFPQQPSAANYYMSPSVAAPGVKFPLPSLYKPTALAGNLTHFGVPTGYGSYGSTAVAYSATPAPVSSTSSEDLAQSELKEKNMYSTLKQNEDSHAWTSAPACDLQTMQANFMYNIPQGHHIAFSPAHSANSSLTGIYPPQSIATPSNAQPLPQQSQTISGTVESVLPSSSAYQQPQPQAQILWNSKLLNRDNIQG